MGPNPLYKKQQPVQTFTPVKPVLPFIPQGQTVDAGNMTKSSPFSIGTNMSTPTNPVSIKEFAGIKNFTLPKNKPKAVTTSNPQTGSGKKFSPIAKKEDAKPGTEGEQKKELGFLDRLFTPEKEGEYSTARKIGTGLANFAEHFGNNLIGASNANVPNRWDAIKQEYREKAPNSDISKLYQKTYSRFGIDTAGKSAWDLKNMHPDIKYLQDQQQMENQFKLASMRPIGGGGVKAEKKIKLDEKAKAELDDHSNAINSSFATRDLINKLNRTAGGSWLPDISADTKAIASQINANRFANARAISGPGAFTETEQENILPLVAGADERAEVARKKISLSLQEGIKKRMGYLDNLKSQGRIDPEDYERLTAEATNWYKQALEQGGSK